jgi:hypothetical protein
MRIRRLLLCVAIFSCGVTSASANMLIVEDRGGQIGRYLQAFARVRSTGERVVVDGECLSACTLVLGLVPPDQICATPRARFGFHAAWMRNMDGHSVPSVKGTRTLWNIYPVSVRRWINQHGGLSDQMIYIEGRSLNGIVATCDRPTQARVTAAESAGYSGTLLQQIVPQFTRSPSARSPLAGSR